jgi:hypothetical protein
LAAPAEAKPKKVLSAKDLANIKAGREKAAAAPAPAPAPAPVAPASPPKKAATEAPGAPVKAAPPAGRKEIFSYLFKLQHAGTVNMLVSDSFLIKRFNMTAAEAEEYVMEYSENYDDLYAQYGPHPKSE